MFNSILAIPSVITENFNLILIGFFGLVALIGFIVGVSKGFFTMSWGALSVLLVSIGFVLIMNFGIGADVIYKFIPSSLSTATQLLIHTVIILSALVLIVGVLLGLVALGRPGKRHNVKGYFVRERSNDPNAKDGYVYNKYKPGFFSRFIGGITGAIQSVAVVGYILILALVLLYATPLSAKIPEIYSADVIVKYMPMFRDYVFDVLCVMLMLSLATAGFNVGFVKGFKAVFLIVGVIAVLVGMVYVPATGFLYGAKLNDVFTNMLSGKLPEKIAGFTPIIAKVITGGITLIGGILAVVIINLILKLFVKLAKSNGFFRFIDGCLSFVFLMIIGLLIFAVVVAIFVTLEHFNILKGFRLSDLFGEGSIITRNVYEALKEHLVPLLQKISSK